MKNSIITYNKCSNEEGLACIYNITNAYIYHNKNKVTLKSIDFDETNKNMAYTLIEEGEYCRYINLDCEYLNVPDLRYNSPTKIIAKILAYLKNHYQPINHYEDIENISKPLKDIVTQVIESTVNMAFIEQDELEEIEKRYKSTWDSIRNTLYSEVKKYRLEGVLEIGNIDDKEDTLLIGYGNLQTMFKFKKAS